MYSQALELPSISFCHPISANIMLLSTIFATTFLTINNLYSICSASPTLESTGGVAARESLNSRGQPVGVYRPADQKCDEITEWNSRNCHPNEGDDIWFDYCKRASGSFYARQGRCAADKMCEDRKIQDKETIACVDRASSSNQVGPDQQIGVEIVQNGDALNAAERIVSVQVQSNLADATVAALIEGMC
jgi:hypothetical protein